jgi:hypothetical protein
MHTTKINNILTSRLDIQWETRLTHGYEYRINEFRYEDLLDDRCVFKQSCTHEYMPFYYHSSLLCCERSFAGDVHEQNSNAVPIYDKKYLW